MKKIFCIGLLVLISSCASRRHETTGYENCMSMVYSGLSKLTPAECRKWED